MDRQQFTALGGKKDVSVVILHPKGRISPIQEAQMATRTDRNVHNLAVKVGIWRLPGYRQASVRRF